MIQTDIPGSCSDVRAGADWLRDSLKMGTSRAGDLTSRARGTAAGEWDGLAGDSYSDFARRTTEVTDIHALRVEDAAMALDSYATHLGQLQERMRQVRIRASAGGLVVAGTIIKTPDTASRPATLPMDATPRELAAHDQSMAVYSDAVAKVELYNRLAEEVAATCTEHERWIADHLEPAARKAEEEGGADGLVGVLRNSAGQFLIGSGLTFTDRTMLAKVKALKDFAADARQKAKDLRKARRSGHPGRRAEGRASDARSRIRGYTEAADDAVSKARWLGWGGKALGPLGLGIDGYFAYQGIQNGESPTGTILSTGGGALAGIGVVAGAGALATAGVVTVPVWGTALVAGAAAVGVGWATSEGWDALPDDFTDSVDDAVTDAWDVTTGVVSDGWDEVTGWF